MLELSENLYLGEGHQRVCYRHPNDKTLCVKVLKPRKSAWRQQLREIEELQKLPTFLEEMPIADFRGKVATNLGDGYVFPLILNADGSEPLNLHDYQKSADFDREALVRELIRLKEFFYRYCVIFRDVNGTNVLFAEQADGVMRLSVIDGVGDRASWPMSMLNTNSWYARRTIRRRWDKFIHSANRGGCLDDVLDQLLWVENPYLSE